MTHTVLRNTRFFGVWCPIAVLGISSIARFQNSDTTHSFKNLVNLGCIGIVAALDNFSQVLSDLSKFEQVLTATLETAIGGAV